jgi:pimeloyl-ACP methyl ester carboxylesterase
LPDKPPPDEITDAEGLRRAYSSPDRLYKHGDRLYIAGTTWEDPKMDVSRPPWYTILLKGLFPQEIPDDFSLNDAVDDLKIPEFKTRDIERYRDAKKFLEAHPDVKQLIGHSMGSSVALQLNADFRNRFETRTYAAPVFHLLPGSDSSDPKDERFRTFGDPVAMFDNAASETVVKPTLNPLELHSYNNYGDVGLS